MAGIRSPKGKAIGSGVWRFRMLRRRDNARQRFVVGSEVGRALGVRGKNNKDLT